MGFSLQDFKDAADKKYGGLVIDDAPGGPLTIRNAMAVTAEGERAALKAAIAKVNDIQPEKAEGEDAPATTGEDLDNLPEIQAAVVDLLAALADRPADLRAYLVDQPMTVVIAIKDAWEESSSPKATS